MSYTIGFVEDNAVNRNTFIQKISCLKDLKLILTATDGNDFLEQLRGIPHNSMPQLIFMDLEMPGMNGIEAIAIAKSMYPQIHFIVLTIFDDDEKIFEAIKAGASGYLLKHESAANLQEAVISLLEHGGAPMSPAIARKTLNLLSSAPLPEKAQGTEIPKAITQREKEILRFMVNGWDAKRISCELNISTLTIRKHIANIYQKLHVNSKAQVISLAHKNRWI